MRSSPCSLRQIHRWLALAVSPFLLLIIVSGMVLAFKPILATAPAGGVDVPALIATLDRIDPHGRAGSLEFSVDGHSLEVRSRRSGPNGRFDAISGVQTGDAGFDIYAFARGLHEGLLIHAKWLVTLVTIITVFLIGSGLSLGWRHLRNSWSGWHAGLGWLALPLMVLTPVTGMLMALHVDSTRPVYHDVERPLSIASALEIASHELDLRQLVSASDSRHGTVMLTLKEGAGSARYLVSDPGGVQRNAGSGWIRMLHEGTWAGAWSGVLALLSAVSLLVLWITGMVPWLRRARPMKSGYSINAGDMTGKA